MQLEIRFCKNTYSKIAQIIIIDESIMMLKPLAII